MKSATKDWLMQRASSLPMIPLFFYFLLHIEDLTSGNRIVLVGWIMQPINATALLIFIVCAFFHGTLGMENIIEDYIPVEGQKTFAMRVNQIFFLVLGLASVYAVSAIHFGYA